MAPANCAVGTCLKSAIMKHRFPNPKKNLPLFHKWVKICANQRLSEEHMTPEMVYNNCRVCHRHFSVDDVGPNNRLKVNVVPHLDVPATSATVEADACVVKADHDYLQIDPQPLTATHNQGTISAVGDNTQDVGSSRPDTYEDNGIPSTSRGVGLFETDFPTNQGISEGDVTPTDQEKHGLLAQVHATRALDLTPKARHLYEKARYYQRRAMRSNRTKLTFKQRLHLATNYTNSDAFKKAVSSMGQIRSRFFECQLENTERKPHGRRYTLEDKILGLALFKQSGKGYKFLSKLFTLPSYKTCIRLLERIPIKPGIIDPVFSLLKAEVQNFKNPLDKYCLLMFDEMSLTPSLTWNKFDGDVEGFEDFGYKRTNKIANHVMVMMLRGVNKKWKQPVYYNFVNGATNNSDISYIIKMIINECQKIGLQVIATVCDQGKNNESAINHLVWETQRKYKLAGKEWVDFSFEINNEVVIPLFDIPHLLKGLRNNLIKSNLRFQIDGTVMVAKWSHIQKAYELDSHLGSLRAMPKLTEQHVNPSRLNKMKVSTCAQVLSRSVAVGLNLMALTGLSATDENGEEIILEQDGQHTAKLLEFCDQLFDSLNGNAFGGDKPLRSAVTENSAHFAFWNDALSILSSMQYITNEGKKFVPPSIKNFIKTIKNFKILFNSLKTKGFTYLMPRTFNQDPVENFFCKIRQRGARNNNPTCSMFTALYKSLLVNTLTSTHSVGANCMEDDSDYLITLQRFITQGLPEEEVEAEQDTFTLVPTEFSETRIIENQIVRYVCGYLLRKAEATHKKNCSCAKELLGSVETGENLDEFFTKLKEFNYNRRKLKYVNDTFASKMRLALQIIQFILNHDLHKKRVFRHIYNILCERITFTTCEHNTDIRKTLFTYFIKVVGHGFIKRLNRIMRGQDFRPISRNAPLIFKNCKDMYRKSFVSRK